MRTLAHLSHLFLPGYSNDHKAKLLHNDSIFTIVILLIFAQILLQFSPSVGLSVLGYASSISVDQVVGLTNQQRASAGVGQLTVNPVLTAAARAKGEDMIARDYWAHVAPDGTQPWKFFIDAGYKYKYAGENLAKDFASASSAVDAWMASPSHKENLLSSKYDEIGIAVVEGDLGGVDTTIIVQLFGRRLDPAPVTTAETVAAKTVVSEEISISTTVAPTPVVSTQPTPTIGQETAAFAGDAQGGVSGGSSMISPFTTTRSITLLSTGFLAAVFLVDTFVITKKRLSRYGGKAFAHIAFLGMILSIAIITQVGDIL